MYVIIYFLYDALMQVLAISKQVLIWSSALILFVFSPYVMGQSLFDDNLNDLSEDDLFSMIFDALGGDDDVIALE